MDKNALTLNRHIPDLVHSWHCLSYTVSKAGSLSVLLSLVTETKKLSWDGMGQMTSL